MELKKELVLRDIAGDFVLIPTGTTVLENNGLFTINEVAARCGYNSASQFISTFEKLMGLTPGAYRKLPSVERTDG